MNKKQHNKFINQRVVLFLVWSIISITTTGIILIPFFADRKTILDNTPNCISKSQFNVECSLCGMTRAFIEISNCCFSNAYKLNKGSLIIYSSFLINSIIYILFISSSIKNTLQL